MNDGFQAQVILYEACQCNTTHTYSCHGTIGDIDAINTGLLQQGRAFENLGRIEPLWWVKLDTHHKLLCRQLLLQACFRALLRKDHLFFNESCNYCLTRTASLRQWLFDLLRCCSEHGSTTVTGIECLTHGGNMARSCATTAADQLHPCFGETHGVVCEVVRGCHIEETVPYACWQTCVWLR